jgi:hypothetical protein
MNHSELGTLFEDLNQSLYYVVKWKVYQHQNMFTRAKYTGCKLQWPWETVIVTGPYRFLVIIADFVKYERCKCYFPLPLRDFSNYSSSVTNHVSRAVNLDAITYIGYFC